MKRALIFFILTSSWTRSLAQDVKTITDRYFQSVGGRDYIETLRTSSFGYTSYSFYPKKDTSDIKTKQLLPSREVRRNYYHNGRLSYESIVNGDSLTIIMKEPFPYTVTNRNGQPISLDPSTEILRLYTSKHLKYSTAESLNGVEYQVLRTNFHPDPRKPNKKFYFDKETGLLVAQKVNDNVTFYKDYRKVKSLLYPFTHELYLNDLLLTRDIYENVEFNIDLGVDDFKSKDAPPLRNLNSKYNRVEFVDPTYSNKSLTDLTNNFQGKRILIDIWATWCGPCKFEFTKYDDSLYIFLSDKNIQMLFISLDKQEKENEWKKDLQWYNLNGYHMMADKTLNNSIKKEINDGNSFAIPRYILIGENGEILSKDIGKPSAPDFRDKVSRLLD